MLIRKITSFKKQMMNEFANNETNHFWSLLLSLVLMTKFFFLNSKMLVELLF